MAVSTETFARIRKMTRKQLESGIAVMVGVVETLGGEMKDQLDLMQAELRYRDAAKKTVIKNRKHDKTLREVQNKLDLYRQKREEAFHSGDKAGAEFFNSVVYEIEAKWLRKLEAI